MGLQCVKNNTYMLESNDCVLMSNGFMLVSNGPMFESKDSLPLLPPYRSLWYYDGVITPYHYSLAL
jgi:hypothetical protein